MDNGQNVNVNNNVKDKNEKTGRGLFYGVIAVATFIVMAVGATFAYFTATTNSGNAAVETGSTTLQLKYISYGAGWMNHDLIPADTTVVEYSFENQDDSTISDSTGLNNALCKDDFGNSICSVYVFQVYNDANSPQTVSIDLVSEANNFYNLNVMAYRISLPTDSSALATYNDVQGLNGTLDPNFRKGNEPDGTTGLINVVDGNENVLDEGSNIANNQYTPIYINRAGVVKTLLKYNDPSNAGSLIPSISIPVVTVGDDLNLIPEKNKENLGNENVAARTSNVATNIEIGGGDVGTFALVLYIANLNSDQTRYDAAKTFTGRVIVGSGDGSTGVSGTISASLTTENLNGLQSNQQQSSGGNEEPSGGSGGEEPDSQEPGGQEP